MSTEITVTQAQVPDPRVRIPFIPAERLAELAARLRPVVRRDGDLVEVRLVRNDRGLRRTSFVNSEDLGEVLDLVPVRTVVTYHAGSNVFFRPTVAEVLAQMPEDLVGKVVAFGTELEGDRVERVDGRHQRALTTFYAAG